MLNTTILCRKVPFNILEFAFHSGRKMRSSWHQQPQRKKQAIGFVFAMALGCFKHLEPRIDVNERCVHHDAGVFCRSVRAHSLHCHIISDSCYRIA